MHEDVGEITEEVFKSAVTIVQNMPKDGHITISNGEKLQFYGLFKQATNGQCKAAKPAIWNVVERYKWDAWSALGSLEPTKAREEYVVKLRQVMDKVFEKHDVNEMMKNESWSNIRLMVEPHFEKIGRPLTSNNFKHKHDKNDAALSTDEEYTDACDSPVLVNNPISTPTPNDPTTKDFKTEVVSYVQTTTQVVLHQIQILSNTIQKQNAIIQKFIDYMNAKQSNPISWPFLLLLFIWPIIVQLAIRYFFRQN